MNAKSTNNKPDGLLIELGDTSSPSATFGWFKAVRSQEVLELIKLNANAFILLFIIAYRARRTDRFNQFNLQPGQAFLGDWEVIGLTEREYRTAKQTLKKFGFATFKATSRGTIATLMDTRVFDINLVQGDGQTDRQTTDARRTGDGQATSNKEFKNLKKVKNENPFVEAFCESWKKAYSEVFNEQGFIGSSDRKLVFEFHDQGFEVSHIVEIARRAWEGSGFFCMKSRSLNFFLRNFESIRGELGPVKPKDFSHLNDEDF